MPKPLILIALGGNALIQKGQQGTAEEQFANLKVPMRQIARLSRHYRIVITHGNGPQAGNLLLQQESCREVPTMPLEIIVAMTQGQIGYMIESSLDRALMEMGVTTEQLFISLISYVVVDEKDPAFQNPTKPIGPLYTEEQAGNLPYTMVKTDKGFRRVVASPEPLAIVEHREIKKLIEMEFIVICCGGGGIPVVRKERKFRGVDAVIDKDLASAVLAQRNQGGRLRHRLGCVRGVRPLGQAGAAGFEESSRGRDGALPGRGPFPGRFYGAQGGSHHPVCEGLRAPRHHLRPGGDRAGHRRRSGDGS